MNDGSRSVFRSPAQAGTAFWMTVVLAALAALGAIAGVLFERDLFAANEPYCTAQVWMQELASLVLLVPILLVSAALMRRGSVPAVFVWLGIVVFLVYVYSFYGMTLYFNRLLLVHTAALGVSIYLLALALVSIDAERIRDWFGPRARLKPAVWFLAIVPVAVGTVWLVDAVPAIIDNKPPEYSVLNGFISSPVHILDLGVFFPGLLVSAILLHKRSPLGYLLAPAFLVFSTVITSCLVEQSLVLQARGYGDDLAMLAVFGAVSAIGAVVLLAMVRRPAAAPAHGRES